MTLTTRKIEKYIEVCSLHPQVKICFGATSLDNIFKWVDTYYAVHHDMKSQTGGVISMVLGVTHFRLSKKKLNIKSSMEVELVGASDYFPYNIWCVMFMHHQG